MNYLVSELFKKVISVGYTDIKMKALRKIYESKPPLRPEGISKGLGKYWTRIPSTIKKYLDDLEGMKLISKDEFNRYKTESLGNLFMSAVDKNPLIVGLRPKYSHGRNFNEEKILTLLLKNKEGDIKTTKYLSGVLEVSQTELKRNIRTLINNNLIRKSTVRHRYLKLEKEVDPKTLPTDQRMIYHILFEENFEYVKGIDILKKLKSQSYYHSGIPPLLDKKIISDKRNLVSYDLTAKGRTVAFAIQEIVDVTVKISSKKRFSRNG